MKYLLVLFFLLNSLSFPQSNEGYHTSSRWLKSQQVVTLETVNAVDVVNYIPVHGEKTEIWEKKFFFSSHPHFSDGARDDDSLWCRILGDFMEVPFTESLLVGDPRQTDYWNENFQKLSYKNIWSAVEDLADTKDFPRVTFRIVTDIMKTCFARDYDILSKKELRNLLVNYTALAQ